MEYRQVKVGPLRDGLRVIDIRASGRTTGSSSRGLQRARPGEPVSPHAEANGVAGRRQPEQRCPPAVMVGKSDPAGPRQATTN